MTPLKFKMFTHEAKTEFFYNHGSDQCFVCVKTLAPWLTLLLTDIFLLLPNSPPGWAPLILGW